MRKMEFKMERTGLMQIGDDLPVKEYKLSNAYYYVLGHAFAMSGNYTTTQRLTSDHGKVVDIQETPKGFYVTVEFDEDPI